MNEVKISVVLPCLNEEKTIEYCIQKAFEGIALTKYTGEVVVADNGSTDASAKIAKTNGARVVNIEEKGYGAALRGGIESAYGDFIVMGDADSTYDFRDLSKIVEELDEGKERVVLRLKSHLSPIKAAVIPLKKNKEELVTLAKDIKSNLQSMGKGRVFLENTGNIGKAYRKHDEVGTPVCITVDFGSLENGTVTLRDRDTMEQRTVAISDLNQLYLDSLK